MLKVGLTGGIGSGKSTVAQIFYSLGVPVYNADKRAKSLVNELPDLKKKIIDLLGDESYQNGIYNRPYIAQIVFTDEEKLAALNRLIHPYSIGDADNWFLQQKSAYIIKEAAILFESGADEHLDMVIGVSAPLEQRIRRVQQRDGLSVEEILRRVCNQMDETEKMKLCDYLIVNDEKQSLIKQVLQLHQVFQRGK